MYKLLKRIFDISVSAVVLILLFPVFIPCIIVLLCTGEHEVIYLQQRIGYMCKPFFIFKFVTMMRGSLKMGTGDITLKDDPRVFPFGKLLRKAKINELPQFVNIFLGGMSLVGPRPLTANTFNYYPENVQRLIGKMKPGITGVGSVIFRDEEKYTSVADNPREFYEKYITPYKGALEVWYAKNASFALDMKLIMITAWVVVHTKSNLPYKWLKGLPPKPDWMD